MYLILNLVNCASFMSCPIYYLSTDLCMLVFVQFSLKHHNECKIVLLISKIKFTAFNKESKLRSYVRSPNMGVLASNSTPVMRQ